MNGTCATVFSICISFSTKIVLALGDARGNSRVSSSLRPLNLYLPDDWWSGEDDAWKLMHERRLWHATLLGHKFAIAAHKNDQAIEPFVVNEQAGDSYKLLDNAQNLAGSILDVGANVGVTTMLLHKLNPLATIYSFEPMPGNVFYILWNLELNKIAKERVNLFRIAIGDNTWGDATELVYDHEYSTGGVASAVDVASSPDSVHPNRPTCPVRNVSSVIAELQISKIDFLKLDCEGCEFSFLAALTPQQVAMFGAGIVEIHWWVAHYTLDASSEAPSPLYQKAMERLCSMRRWRLKCAGYSPDYRGHWGCQRGFRAVCSRPKFQMFGEHNSVPESYPVSMDDFAQP
eukprot:TRINITY_DN41562_c0_g1_i1.p1 TRINITY_DN41562_c0_g1~~TRINITY_DN41562_c0_g1_i1.p1  ORF type:complete len:346 (-),score=17.19 TRINITY_DN41562_c0_g1_i1:130-1167(-)